MKRRFCISKWGVLGALFMMMVLLVGSATAQPLNWNPPCGTITIRNTTACTARFTIVTTPGFLPAPLVVPAGGVVNFPAPIPMAINSIISFNGNFYPMILGGPVMPPPAPAVPPCGWIPSVALGPPPACCFDIFFDCRAGFCTVWLIAAPVPCRP